MRFQYHTKIKLHMLSYYLTICAKVHSKNPDKFTYFETHAGDGLVTLPDDSTTEGSAVIAASSKLKFPCVLTERLYHEELEKNLRSELGEIDHVTILPVDCNERIDEILRHVKAHYHSLGFVDPSHPGELKWSTIESIGSHEHKYQTGDIRRPEMLLNFPIGRIKRNAGWLDKTVEGQQQMNRRQTAIKHNDDFFGTTEWQEVWRKSEDLTEFFLGRLMGLGYTACLHTQVDEIQNHVPIYVLMLLISQHKAEEVLPGLAKGLERWQREDYVREYYKVHDLAKWVK